MNRTYTLYSCRYILARAFRAVGPPSDKRWCERVPAVLLAGEICRLGDFWRGVGELGGESPEILDHAILPLRSASNGPPLSLSSHDQRCMALQARCLCFLPALVGYTTSLVLSCFVSLPVTRLRGSGGEAKFGSHGHNI